MVNSARLELGSTSLIWAVVIVIAVTLNSSKLCASAIEESELTTSTVVPLSPFRLPNQVVLTVDTSRSHRVDAAAVKKASCDAQVQQWQAFAAGYELVATLQKNSSWSAVLKWDAHRYQWVKEGEHVASESVWVSAIAEGTALLTRNVWQGGCIAKSVSYLLRYKAQP